MRYLLATLRLAFRDSSNGTSISGSQTIEADLAVAYF